MDVFSSMFVLLCVGIGLSRDDPSSMELYSAFNQGGNREESVEPEHFSRIAALTADSRMSH
jgi:hypothetical protein